MKADTPRPGTHQALLQAIQLFNSGLNEEARVLCEKILADDSQQAEAMGLLGAIATKTGKPEIAIELLTRAVAIRPANPTLHIERDNAYIAAGKLGDAMHHCKETIKRFPDQAVPHFNLANVLQQQERLDEAIGSYQSALSLRPGLATAWNNLGNVYKKQGNRQEALSCYEQALKYDPNLVQADLNVGLELQEQGDLDRAIAHYSSLLERHPGNARAHFHRSSCRLLAGDFKQGWPEYEWRWKVGNITKTEKNFVQPVWDGTPNDGGSILLYAEQGLGDTFQFVRYIPLVAEYGLDVIFECPRKLIRVLHGISEFARIVPEDNPLPAFDCHAPLMSLPGIMGTDADSVPSRVPYLRPEPELVAQWNKKLGVQGQFNIGICWQGSKANKNDMSRSVALQRFLPLARMPGIKLVSLQKFAGQEQLRSLHGDAVIEDLGAVMDIGDDAFVETAAVMENLDLVITVDTAVAHLAGALGRPVWVLLPFVPDWRWMMGREDSSWYPSMRLFRQQHMDDWDNVFQRVSAALRAFASDN